MVKRVSALFLFTWHVRNQLSGKSWWFQCIKKKNPINTPAVRLWGSERPSGLCRCLFKTSSLLPLIPSSNAKSRATLSSDLPPTWTQSREHDGSAAGWIKRWPVSDFHQPWNALFAARQAYPKTVIRNDANNRSRHISGYYKQTDGSRPGRVWQSGEILEGLEGEELCLWHWTVLWEFWLNSPGRQSFHLQQPQECHKYGIWRFTHLLQTIKRNPRNCINKHKNNTFCFSLL